MELQYYPYTFSRIKRVLYSQVVRNRQAVVYHPIHPILSSGSKSQLCDSLVTNREGYRKDCSTQRELLPKKSSVTA
jgi:hypothetical protein